MANILENFTKNPDARIVITSGIEDWDVGEITLSVSGDGSAKITNRRTGNTTEYLGQLSAEQVQDFAEVIRDADFANLTAAGGMRKPDDVMVKIYLYSGDDVVASNERLWHGDRYTDAKLNAIIMAYDKLVEEISDGKLPYG